MSRKALYNIGRKTVARFQPMIDSIHEEADILPGVVHMRYTQAIDTMAALEAMLPRSAAVQLKGLEDMILQAQNDCIDLAECLKISGIEHKEPSVDFKAKFDTGRTWRDLQVESSSELSKLMDTDVRVYS